MALKRIAILFFLIALVSPCFGQDKPEGINIPALQDKGLVDAQFFFDGRWLPDVDPIKIGPNNFKTLKNMRYTDTGIQGVEGYSKVNSTVLPAAQNYTVDYTEVDTSLKLTITATTITATSLSNQIAYVYRDMGEGYFSGNYNIDFDVVLTSFAGHPAGFFPFALANSVGDIEAITAAASSSVFYVYITSTGLISIRHYNKTTGATTAGGGVSISTATTYYCTISKTASEVSLKIFSDSGKTSEISGSPSVFTSNENTFFRYIYGFSSSTLSVIQPLNAVVSNLDLLNSIQNGHQLRSDYTTKSYVLASTPSAIWQNTTAIPSQGDFESLSLYTQADGVSTGRFSKFPGGNIGFANEKESLIWAGNEMPVAGFWTITELAESYNNCTITTGTNIISFVAGTDLITDGYKSGQTIIIDGSTTNDGEVTIYTMTTTAITTVEDLTSEAAAQDITLTVVRPDKGVIDHFDAVTNKLTTTGNVVTVGDELDSNTKLLLHFDGTEGSTTFTDSSDSAHGSATVYTMAVDTYEKKFGTGSLYLDKASGESTPYTSYLTFADSDDWSMGTGRFTIDFWYKNDGIVGNLGFFDQNPGTIDDLNYISFEYTSQKLRFNIVAGGVSQIAMTSSNNPIKENSWYHIAVIRGWEDTDNRWAITVDGKEVVAMTSSANWGNLTGVFYIGTRQNNVNLYLDGWMDEFRVTKGKAVWTSEFAPPGSPYRNGQSQFLVMSTRPLQGIKTYISEANTYSSTLTGKYWSGNTFSNLDITDGTSSLGVSLAQTGTVSFSSTVNDARPYHFQGTYFYAYLFDLSSGYANVYQVTGDADFQHIVDIWNGVYRVPRKFQIWDNSEKVYQDYTLEILTESVSTSTFGATLSDESFTMAGGSDHIIVLFDDKMAGVRLAMANVYSNTSTTRPIIDRWNGAEWVDVGQVIDTTISDKENWNSLGQSGLWAWNPPEAGEEKTISMFGSTGYAYSISFNNDVGTNGTVIIDTVYGIPSQYNIKTFKFPAFFKSRALLCNYKEGNEGNRIDYSVTGLADVWNGTESSDDGYQSLYVGGNDEIVAGTQLFNRYGNNIFTTFLAIKKDETYLLAGSGPDDYRIYPISDQIGIVAPLTLSTSQGFKIAEDITRNVAIWLSHSGPVLFDGSAIHIVPGIGNYFDPANSEYINTDLIELSRAWYDQTYDEWNLLIPSGSSATKNNKWLVWARKYNKWYEKVPYLTYPQSAWPVYDLNGIQYIYAGTDDGYMLRLEESTLWNTDPITYTWETGDFSPSKNIWDLFRMQWFKVYAKDIAETATVTMKLYTDTAASDSRELSGFRLEQGSNRIVRDTQGPLNELAWSFRVEYSVTMGDGAGAAEKALEPIGWGYRGYVENKDIY